MKLHEYQSEKLLKSYGVPVSNSVLVTDEAQAAAAFDRLANPSCMGKVQVLMGGRGKAGGVERLETRDQAKAFAARFLGKPFSTYQSGGESKIVRSVLITQTTQIRQEYYLGIVIDRSAKRPAILFSVEGGVEIEEVARKNPSAIYKLHFSQERMPDEKSLTALLKSSGLERAVLAEIINIALKLSRIFIEKDCSICEINPLVLTSDNRVVALDAKIVIDDNALYRHPDLSALKDPDEEDAREQKAKAVGLSYVSMNGQVGCLVNGAGLAMATMDMIKRAGAEPANFLDIGGGASADRVKEGFKLILEDGSVQAILVNIFGGINKCDEVALGVVQACREIKLSVPLVVRLEGTHVEQGKKIIRESGLAIHSADTTQQAAALAASLLKKKSSSHVHTR